MNDLKLFIQYLNEQRRKIIVLAIMFAAFFLVVFLYDYPTEMILYGTLLSGVIGLLGAGFDFIAYRRSYLLLQEASHHILLSLDELPEANGLHTECYHQLLSQLLEGKKALQMDADQRFSDMMDYFVLWAHQIKTPISAMHSLLQAQESGDLALRAELFKIEQYVEMALSYMRMESKSTDYLLKEYELDAIVRKSIRKYSRLFIQKDLSVQFAKTEQMVLTDEKWLGFSLDQLLSNAIKYTTKGCISVYWDGQALVIEDTGIGIPPSDLPRVFDKGFTGYNGRIDSKSTGLGLYLCKRSLSNISHKIQIESNAGGTKVRITFPKP